MDNRGERSAAALLQPAARGPAHPHSRLAQGTRAPAKRPTSDGTVDIVRDRALVERFQHGDLAAFDELYLLYRERLLRFCTTRLHDDGDAQDAAQEAFVRAWRALPRFSGDLRFYPWLSVIAANICTDVLRRRARIEPEADLERAQERSVSPDTPAATTEDQVLQNADVQMLHQALAHLSARHRRILTMREQHGWSYQRIADAEGVRVSAVETLLWRARQALRREFMAIAGPEGASRALVFVALASMRRALARMHAVLGQGARSAGRATRSTAMRVSRRTVAIVLRAGAAVASPVGLLALGISISTLAVPGAGAQASPPPPGIAAAGPTNAMHAVPSPVGAGAFPAGDDPPSAASAGSTFGVDSPGAIVATLPSRLLRAASTDSRLGLILARSAIATIRSEELFAAAPITAATLDGTSDVASAVSSAPQPAATPAPSSPVSTITPQAPDGGLEPPTATSAVEGVTELAGQTVATGTSLLGAG